MKKKLKSILKTLKDERLHMAQIENTFDNMVHDARVLYMDDKSEFNRKQLHIYKLCQYEYKGRWRSYNHAIELILTIL